MLERRLRHVMQAAFLCEEAVLSCCQAVTAHANYRNPICAKRDWKQFAVRFYEKLFAMEIPQCVCFARSKDLPIGQLNFVDCQVSGIINVTSRVHNLHKKVPLSSLSKRRTEARDDSGNQT